MNGGARAGEGRRDIAGHIDLVLEGISDAVDGRCESSAGRRGDPPACCEPSETGAARIRGDTGNRISEVAGVTAPCNRHRRPQEKVESGWRRMHGGREGVPRRMTGTQLGCDRTTQIDDAAVNLGGLPGSPGATNAHRHCDQHDDHDNRREETDEGHR